MCAKCETHRLCERLDKQIKNIEAGGSVSPEAIATIMREARAQLVRFVDAASLSDAILHGKVDCDVVVVGGLRPRHDDPAGGLH